MSVSSFKLIQTSPSHSGNITLRLNVFSPRCFSSKPWKMLNLKTWQPTTTSGLPCAADPKYLIFAHKPHREAEPTKMLRKQSFEKLHNYTCACAELGCNRDVVILTKQFSCKDWKELYLGSPKESKEALPSMLLRPRVLHCLDASFPHSL